MKARFHIELLPEKLVKNFKMKKKKCDELQKEYL